MAGAFDDAAKAHEPAYEIAGTTLVAGAALIESSPTLTRQAAEGVEPLLG
ncbi:MAG: hypothetical protein FJZ00_05350 [Candidatus Sericytochromatia bacterium]|uniref:Uncharacterized protein n=1 Tax=Candidatus Tanganyikabacteria bacterium TaxID=2961651 RepID=A0A937X252_9BACT|nr:hypothetical protein [Candidatus Tanganyikabacteria bacterium]